VPDSDRHQLSVEHQPDTIARRLRQPPAAPWAPDAVLGGIDGCITTFAIVAGTVGAGLPPATALILGMANLVADGFSMAASRFEAGRAEQDHLQDMRREEQRHIEHIPEGELEELRQIYAGKGFEGDTLERIVATISANRQTWLETMLTEELGLQRTPPRPMRAALVTFSAFVVVGAVPLLPLLSGAPARGEFILSASLAAGMFFLVGTLKRRKPAGAALRSGLQTLLTGSLAAGLAFAAGYLLRSLPIMA
jgi:VIT1/CCC1 family predicted Fe2+/Mn2+ transporter